MSSDDFLPIEDVPAELAKLGQDYQILTELHHGAASRTYLARHLGLNRDVTINVVRAKSGTPGGRRNEDLTELASDARVLSAVRHPNVVPVIEGRWLGDDLFAVVRARVRGSSLDQTLSAVGPLSLARAASALEQVNAALEWARTNGVSHRHVSADSLVFQQGSGRVLVGLDPAPEPSHPLPNACDDARTIGELAFAMFTGYHEAMERPASLEQARPELPPRIADATNALLACDRSGAAPDVRAYLALLAAAETEEAVPAAMPAAAAAEEAAVGAAAGASIGGATAGAAKAAAAPAADVVVVNSSFGFNARLVTALAVAAAIIVMGILLLRQRSGESHRDATTSIDSTVQASGDVASRARAADTALLAAVPQQPIITAPPIDSSALAPTPQPPVQVYQPPAYATPPVDTSVGGNVSPIAPPGTRRHEPTRTIPPAVYLPAPAPASPPTDTTRPPATTGTGAVATPSAPPGDACASPAAADQQSCLSTAVQQGDRALNDVYQQLVTALRRKAHVQPGDPDPPAVDDLRSTQRQWMESRDAACHAAGDGPLYARARAACYADQASQRTRELQQMLDTVPKDTTPVTPRDTSSSAPPDTSSAMRPV